MLIKSLCARIVIISFFGVGCTTISQPVRFRPDDIFLKKVNDGVSYELHQTSLHEIKAIATERVNSMAFAYIEVKERFAHIPEVVAFVDQRIANLRKPILVRLEVEDVKRRMKPSDSLYRFYYEGKERTEIGILALAEDGAIRFRDVETSFVPSKTPGGIGEPSQSTNEFQEASGRGNGTAAGSD